LEGYKNFCLKGGATVMEEKRIKLTPTELTKLSDDNLYTLLVDLQKATTNLMMEGWRRGLQEQMAVKAMEMKTNVPKQ
jgi:hypothetical protein